MDTIGERIREARLTKGLTQEAAARLIGGYKQNFCSWEKGVIVPRVGTLGLIAKALDVSVNYLCGLDDVAAPPSVEAIVEGGGLCGGKV